MASLGVLPIQHEGPDESILLELDAGEFHPVSVQIQKRARIAFRIEHPDEVEELFRS